MSSDQPAELSNSDLSLEVIQACWRAGCREFVICAGSRNSPLVLELLSLAERTEELRIWNYYEERSAAFFALGRSKITGIPTTVLTTSGTAAAELLPAVIEAHYSNISLILVTADRPLKYRDSGAPQTINQKGLMDPFTENSIDINAADLTGLSKLSHRGIAYQRWHINVCFDEPLVSDGEGKRISLFGAEDQTVSLIKVPTLEPDVLDVFIGDREGLVVLSGYLHPEQRSPSVFQWLKRLGCPIWAEASSGLRENDSLSDLIIRSGDQYFSKNVPTKVLRIGEVPSLRFWRDLETLRNTDVLSVDPPNGYSGLGRYSQTLVCDLASLIEVLPLEEQDCKIDLSGDREDWYHLRSLLEKYPLSEPAWISRFSQQIPSGSLVYLGNSMPIREWNLTASFDDRELRCFASRGANGIDGQCSTYMGMSVDKAVSWGIFGDLTTLYDLSAPWPLKQMKQNRRRFVVINNGGGKIFSQLPHLAGLPDNQKAVTENQHQMDFENWAAMWGMWYHKITTVEELSMDSMAMQDSVVFEVCPDTEQTEAFWNEFNAK